jgi:hypothetical protein
MLSHPSHDCVAQTYAAIDSVVTEIFKLCPLVLIDVATGRLCDAQERVWMFKSDTLYSKLLFEIAITTMDRTHIRQSVAKYFKWIMFSHTWEGKEPTFKDVNLVDSIWKLDNSLLNEKLRQFCKMAHKDGYRWAWSDTCCIDKATSTVLSQSLTSMYRWYEEAAETLVYLADVLSLSVLGDLTKSRWMTRAWTLQELLAPKRIRFYDREWKPYLNDNRANHKESPAIKQELAHAMGVAPETITSFRPQDLGVREKLRLASTRNATVEEDIAYSLIGIFSSDIAPRYGLGKDALGQLLENIVARSGDVTVIAWTGTPLSYNSALPDSLAVYSQIPYSPPPMEANELDTCVEQLRIRLAPQDVTAFYNQVIPLPRATFSNRCLQLPCIMFSVGKIGVHVLGGSQGKMYHAAVSLLGKVEFKTADAMPLKHPWKLVFVHPWLRDLHDPLGGFVPDDEQEVESDAGSDDEWEAESDAGPDDEQEAESDAGSDDEWEDESDAGPDDEQEAESDGDEDDCIDDASAPASPLYAEPSPQVDTFTQALRMIARLGCPFNALLLERQPNGQYKRVAANHEILVPGLPSKTNPKDIRAMVLEIV